MNIFETVSEAPIFNPVNGFPVKSHAKKTVSMVPIQRHEKVFNYMTYV